MSRLLHQINVAQWFRPLAMACAVMALLAPAPVAMAQPGVELFRIDGRGSSGHWMYIEKLRFMDRDVGFAIGYGDAEGAESMARLFHTSNGGASWRNSLSTREDRLVDVHVNSHGYGCAIAYRDMWITTDSGTSWSSVPATERPNRGSNAYFRVRVGEDYSIRLLTHRGWLYERVVPSAPWRLADTMPLSGSACNSELADAQFTSDTTVCGIYTEFCGVRYRIGRDLVVTLSNDLGAGYSRLAIDGNVVAVKVGFGDEYVHITSDLGVTWKRQRFSMYSCSTVAVRNGCIAVISDDLIAISPDTGRTWPVKIVGQNLSGIVGTNDVQMFDCETIYGGGSKWFLRTTTGGVGPIVHVDEPPPMTSSGRSITTLSSIDDLERRLASLPSVTSVVIHDVLGRSMVPAELHLDVPSLIALLRQTPRGVTLIAVNDGARQHRWILNSE
jgi:hypothetical protein